MKMITGIPVRFLAMIVLFGIFSCSSSRSSSGQSISHTTTFSKNELIRQINAVRVKGCNCGGSRYPAVKPIKWNETLAEVANGHSRYMQQTNRMSHTGSNNSTPGKRVKTAGYSWSYVAENIAMGQRSTSEVMQSWLNSPGHCKNIMSPYVTEIGAALSGRYWTLVLANRQ